MLKKQTLDNWQGYWEEAKVWLRGHCKNEMTRYFSLSQLTAMYYLTLNNQSKESFLKV